MGVALFLDYIVTALDIVSAALLVCGACLVIGYRIFCGDRRRVNRELPRLLIDE